jgi:hypothetical protein
MPAEFDRAVTFVREHGDEFDRARLDALLEKGSLISRDQKQRFLAGQRLDGGWAPFWAADYSSLDATCFRLARGEVLGLSVRHPAHPAVDTALAFLRARQRPDGSWEEDEALRDQAPERARPGALAPRLYPKVTTSGC